MGLKIVFRKCVKLGGFFLIMLYLYLYIVMFVLYNIIEIY